MDSQQYVLLRSVLCAMIMFSNSSGQGSSNKTSSFGKTHFIRGLPHKYIDHGRVKGVDPQPIRRRSRARAFFSPDDDLQRIIIGLINNEQEKIQIAMYLFTDDSIAQALKDAYNHGIVVQLITDQECLDTKTNIIDALCSCGIPVYVYPSFMHDKFVIFEKNKTGKSLVWTGSYNFTRSGGESNQENAVLIDDRSVVKRYKKQFELLKQESKKVARSKKGKKKSQISKKYLKKQ